MFGRYWCTLQALASILFTILFSVISNRTVRILPADPSVLFLLVECTTKTLLCATRHHQESRTNQKRCFRPATNGSTHNQCSLEHILGSTTTSLTLIGAHTFDDYGARSQEPHSTSQTLGPWGGGPCPQARLGRDQAAGAPWQECAATAALLPPHSVS